MSLAAQVPRQPAPSSGTRGRVRITDQVAAARRTALVEATQRVASVERGSQFTFIDLVFR